MTANKSDEKVVLSLTITIMGVVWRVCGRICRLYKAII